MEICQIVIFPGNLYIESLENGIHANNYHVIICQSPGMEMAWENQDGKVERECGRFYPAPETVQSVTSDKSTL